jgi:uncharacterized DUF497 family protein
VNARVIQNQKWADCFQKRRIRPTGEQSGFEWDDKKDIQNRTKHGIGFRTAVEIFDDPARTEKRSDKHDEERWLTTGSVLGNLWTLIYAKRGDTIAETR